MVVADVPVWREGREAGVDVCAAADPAADGDARVRLGRARRDDPGGELRAVARRHRDAGDHFDLDPDTSHRIEEEWFDRRLGIPLDVVEAPFRDLTGPMLDRGPPFTARSDTLVTVVLPEFIVPSGAT